MEVNTCERQAELVIDLTEKEIFTLLAGHLVSDRINPYGVGAKINFRPCSREYDTGLRSKPTLEVSGDNDMDISFDERILEDVRNTGLYFQPESITSSAGNDHLEHFRQVLPENGVVVRFAGSLTVINAFDDFYDI